MGVRNRSKGRKAARTKHFRPDLYEILARFSDARSFLECGVRLLESWQGCGPGTGDESVCLRHGLKLLVSAYKDLDVAISLRDLGADVVVK